MTPAKASHMTATEPAHVPAAETSHVTTTKAGHMTAAETTTKAMPES
jgi:hypothetical protein